MSDTKTTSAYLDAFKRVEPGSERHQQLIDAYRAKEETDAVFEGMSKFVSDITDPGMIGEMYGQMFGVMPDFPEGVVKAPTWASSHDDPGTDRAGHPTRLWVHKVANDDEFYACITRDDYYDDDTKTVVVGPIRLDVAVNGADVFHVDSTQQMRDLGQRFITAADAIDARLTD